MARKRVVILGGGPAGTAISLAFVQAGGLRHADLALYYRSPPTRRSMGESLPPAARTLFADLGIGALLDDPAHGPCPGSLSVWGSDQPVANDFMLDVAGQGTHADRARLETDLLAKVDAVGGCIHADHALQGVQVAASGYELTLRGPSGKLTTHADFVVDATGQAAAFARRLPVARNVVDEVISVYAVLDVPAGCELPDYTMVEAIADGWWYLAKLPDGKAYLALTTDKQTLAEKSLGHEEAWHQTYADTLWLKSMLAVSGVPSLALRQAPACSSILSRCVGTGWLAAGDAACSTDALMSAGVTRGMYQGMQAGQTIAANLAGNGSALTSYQDAIFQQFNRYLGQHHDLYGRERRFAKAGFWQRRQHCMTTSSTDQ